MDAVKKNWKKNMLVKAWERCRSLGKGQGGNKSSCRDDRALKKSKSWHCSRARSVDEADNNNNNNKGKNKCKVAPVGCFSVYVGPQRQRFVVKTEFANHPSFKMLLEDAELEYGFNSEGPLLLPCDVDLFYKVLAEMDCGDDRSKEAASPICSFAAYSPLLLCSPSRNSHKGYGSYQLLTPSRMLKLNS